MVGAVATSQQKGVKNIDQNRNGKQIHRAGTQADGDPSAERQQAGAGAGGTDHTAGDGSAGDGHEVADRGREADPRDADDQRGSRPYRALL